MIFFGISFTKMTFKCRLICQCEWSWSGSLLAIATVTVVLRTQQEAICECRLYISVTTVYYSIFHCKCSAPICSSHRTHLRTTGASNPKYQLYLQVWTANLLVIRQPVPPPELQSYRIVYTESYKWAIRWVGKLWFHIYKNVFILSFCQ